VAIWVAIILSAISGYTPSLISAKCSSSMLGRHTGIPASQASFTVRLVFDFIVYIITEP